MKKLLIVSMLGLGLLAQANEQDKELSANTQAELAPIAEQAEQQTATEATAENKNEKSEIADIEPKQEKKSSSVSLTKQYTAGFLFGAFTGVGCRLAGGKQNKDSLFVWMGEWALRNSTLDCVRRDMERFKGMRLADGTYLAAQVGSWTGYLAACALLQPAPRPATTEKSSK